MPHFNTTQGIKVRKFVPPSSLSVLKTFAPAASLSVLKTFAEKNLNPLCVH